MFTLADAFDVTDLLNVKKVCPTSSIRLIITKEWSLDSMQETFVRLIHRYMALLTFIKLEYDGGLYVGADYVWVSTLLQFIEIKFQCVEHDN